MITSGCQGRTDPDAQPMVLSANYIFLQLSAKLL